MNVLQITTHLNTGGISAYMHTLSKGLISKGCRVIVASSGGNTEKELNDIGAETLIINIKTKSELSPRIYSAVGPLVKFVKENKIDIIHAHTRVTQVLAYFVARRTGVPFVATAHGFFKPRFFRKVFPCWGDETVAISSQVAQHVINDFHIPEKRVHVIGNGINLDKFPVINEKIRNQRREELRVADKNVIGMVARLSDVKGQDILLGAMPLILREFPDAVAVLVGEGKLEGILDQKIKKLNLQDNVRIIKETGDVYKFLCMFDVYVNPSRMEGLGLSVMEAQACGLPVVASRVGGIPSIITHARTGYLVEPEDEGALAAMICKVLHNPNDAYKVGREAAESARLNYGADVMTERTFSVYTGALKK